MIDTHRFFAPFLATQSDRVAKRGIDTLRFSATAFGFAGFAATVDRERSSCEVDDAFRAVVMDRVRTLESPPPGLSSVEADFPLIEGEIPWIHRVEFDSDERQSESLTVGVGESFGIINSNDLTNSATTVSRWMDILILGLCFWSQQEAIDSETFLRLATIRSEGDSGSGLSEESSWVESVTTVPMAMTSIEQNLPRDLQIIWIDAMRAWRMDQLLASVKEKVELYKKSIARRQEERQESRAKTANLILAVIGASTLGAFLELLVSQATNDQSLDFGGTHPGRWILISLIIFLVAFGVLQIYKKGGANGDND